MGIKSIVGKLVISLLVYILAYNSMILLKYHPDLSFSQWILRPIIDVYHLYFLATFMYILTNILVFNAIDVIFKKKEHKRLLKELKEISEKCDEGKDFISAINILRHTRFSYILGQNSNIIEVNHPSQSRGLNREDQE